MEHQAAPVTPVDPEDAALRAAYLVALGELGTVKAALDRAGVKRRHLDDVWRKDPEFVRDEADSRADYADLLEGHALRRATGFQELVLDKDGVPYVEKDALGDPVYGPDGRPVYRTRTVYNDPLLPVVLKARVAGYGDKTSLEVSGPGGAPVQVETDVRVRFVLPEGVSASDYPPDGAGA